MSKYSGKCDFRDCIAGLGGWFDKDGNPVKMGDGTGAYYSDEMLDFIAFKKKTGGVMYQNLKVIVTEANQDLVAKKCSYFDVIKHTKKKGFLWNRKEVVYYTYKYFNKEYKSLKQVNEHSIYILKEIHFDSLLDIIPYYPYIVSAYCSDGDKITVHLSSRSYVDEQEDEALQRGWERSYTSYYREQLQNHYRDVILNYYNPTGREVTESITFDKDRIGQLTYSIDEDFPVE